MINKTRTLRQLALVVSVISMFNLAGCGKGASGNTPEKEAQAKALLSPEDLLTVSNSALASGPSITGSIEPERRADLRAEVSAVVLAVLKDNGDPVKRGDLIVRLDQTSIRDSLTAAEASSRAAEQAYEQAERQFQRMKTLRETGVVSTQQLEDVEIRRNSAQSDRAEARTRVVTARQQLARTEVRAPFDGIVSDRKVSAGDTAAIGKELVKVIDPTSLRFEGLVSADSIGEVKAGQHVWFKIHGFSTEEFTGVITRVNPAANVTTRQVEVLVAFDDSKKQPNVAGLYAEGHVETRSTAALSLPSASIINEGDSSFAWRVKDAKLQKVALTLGERDARTGAFALRSGLAEGDKVLRFPNSTLKDGQEVETGSPAKPALVVEKK
ncbi:MAG TPA: efflux RND transporter periplasmic adaptor subunit [Steroidobacteraceae bacterium]|nr:efflux RND transporter periplasmic adaptor subunit [Steroidobacteraceae bacterium]